MYNRTSFNRIFTIFMTTYGNKRYKNRAGLKFMAEFSVENMQEIRKAKGLTYEALADLTGIPKSTITKVFGGFQTNPGASFLAKIATALDCGIDDFFIWEKEPASPFSSDRKMQKSMEMIYENPELKNLLSAAKSLSPDAVNSLANSISLIKNSK